MLFTCLLLSFTLVACGRSAERGQIIRNPVIESTVDPFPTVDVQDVTALASNPTATPTQTIATTVNTDSAPEPMRDLAVATAAPSPSPSPTATATPSPTEPPPASATVALVPTVPMTTTAQIERDPAQLVLLAKRNQTVVDADKSDMTRMVRQVLFDVRSLVYLLNTSRESGVIDCNAYAMHYQNLLDSALTFAAPASLALANYHYNRAAEDAIVKLGEVDQQCQADADAGRLLQMTDLDSAEFDTLLNHANRIMKQINDALAWLVGDIGKTAALYRGTRNTLLAFGALLEGNLLDDCAAVHDTYSALIASQRPSPPSFLLRPFEFYSESLDEVERQASLLDEQCQALIEGDGSVMISAEAISEAKNGYLQALYLIDEAIRLLPVPTPEPTLVPVTARVLQIEPAATEGFYNIVMRITVRNDVVSNSANIGQFTMTPNRLLTVLHSCSSDFFDHIEVTTVDGQQLRSPKFSVERPDFCQ